MKAAKIKIPATKSKRLRTNELFFDADAPFKPKVVKSQKGVYKRRAKYQKRDDQ